MAWSPLAFYVSSGVEGFGGIAGSRGGFDVGNGFVDVVGDLFIFLSDARRKNK